MSSFDEPRVDGPVRSGTDPAIGLQGAALVSELRRLQRALAHDMDEEARHRFDDDGVGVANAPRRGSGRRSARQSRTGRHPRRTTRDGWLDMLGLVRRRPGADRAAPALAPAVGRAGDVGIGEPSREPSYAVPDEREIHTRPSALGAAVGRLRPVGQFLLGRTRDIGDEGESRLNVRARRAFDDELRTGLRVLLSGIGVLGTWATLVPLSAAVVVPGTLVVESSVKKIQHPTGGVVARIVAQDGMHVNAGDLVVRLDETQARTSARVLANQLDQTRARIARLVAERDGKDSLRVPPELAPRLADAELGQLWASEAGLFAGRAEARRGAKELLRSRIDQLGEQIAGIDAQMKSKSQQSSLILGELEGVESLYQKGLVPLTRKTSLQREAARLDGERGQAASAIAEARSRISEAELQILRIDQDFRAEVMKDLREAQDKEAELIEKGVAARDLLDRVDVRAPVTGTVHQLSVHTIGGVVAPGETLMEIVPESDDLQVEAHLPPQDIDQVRRGQTAHVRFSAFSQRTTPQLEGVVSYVSADLAHERQSNSAFYTVRVMLPGGQRSRLGSAQILSGMPVEMFLETGHRTMMSYLLKPISDQFKRMFNER